MLSLAPRIAVPVLAGVLLAGCGSSEDTATPAAASGDTRTAGSSTVSTVAAGQPVDLKGPGVPNLTVTAQRVVDPAQSSDDLVTPAPGSRFVAVQLSIKITGAEEFPGSAALMTEVVDSTGKGFNASLVAETTAGPALPTGTPIAAGGTASGYLVFEVPGSSTITSVTFTMLAGDKGTWKV